MEKYESIILSLGGSLIVPNGGIDSSFLKKFNEFIRKQLTSTNRRFFIVCGGGKTARHYMKAAKDVIGWLKDDDVDWLGIHATRINAHLIRTIFRDVAHPVIIEDYEKDYNITSERIIVGAGCDPGCSTDYDSVLIAKRFGAKKLINLSNVDHVYDKDPKEPGAKALIKMSWDEYRKIAGDKWIPGMNKPFDPIAAELAQKVNLKVIILNGKDLVNLGKALDNGEFVGTTIK